MGKRRARVINDDVIEVVLHILDGWKGKLTWDALIAAVKASISAEYTRQALSGHKRIADAFVLRKGGLAKEVGKKPSGDARINGYLETISRLKAENQRLTSELNNYREMFIRWTFNAQKKNLTSELLNRPMVAPNRDVTQE
ncbi:MAG: hypothetical protein JZU60_02430 [Ilumatobacteraceae bacterium]|nr:hypothetical protein [Ilumatobacteraceae bacterium]